MEDYVLLVSCLLVSIWWAGEDSHLYSNAALLRSVGLTHAQPARWCCSQGLAP